MESTTSSEPSLIPARTLEPAERRRARRSGELIEVRRGAYVQARDLDTGRRGVDQRQRAADRAVLSQLGPDACLCRESAALLWDLPLLDPAAVTHVVQQHRPGSRRDRRVRRHLVTVPAEQVVVYDGMRVTSLERTALDCASALRAPAGLAVVDAALHRGADPAKLLALVDGRIGARGVRRARAVLAWADAGAESPGESVTRWALREHGLPAPTVQCPVLTRLGVFRADLGWPELKVAVEFDGRVKYGGGYGAGVDVLVAEKRRQDAMDEAGWIVIRVVWSDLADPAGLARRVASALSRARSRRPATVSV